MKVVAAFVSPSTQEWQGMSVCVTEDGTWWIWTGQKWEKNIPAVPACIQRDIPASEDPPSLR